MFLCKNCFIVLAQGPSTIKNFSGWFPNGFVIFPNTNSNSRNCQKCLSFFEKSDKSVGNILKKFNSTYWAVTRELVIPFLKYDTHHITDGCHNLAPSITHLARQIICFFLFTLLLRRTKWKSNRRWSDWEFSFSL